MLAQRRLAKAKWILVKAAQANKRDIPKDLDEQLEHFARCFVADFYYEMFFNQYMACRSVPIVPQVSWLKLWQGVPRKSSVLCLHYAFAVYILLFNSMVLNITAYGQKHIHMNTVVMGWSN